MIDSGVVNIDPKMTVNGDSESHRYGRNGRDGLLCVGSIYE